MVNKIFQKEGNKSPVCQKLMNDLWPILSDLQTDYDANRPDKVVKDVARFEEWQKKFSKDCDKKDLKQTGR